MTTGKTIERIPVILRTKDIPGGDRKLVASECGEYLVLNRRGGEIDVAVYNRRADAFKAYADCGELGGTGRAGVDGIPPDAVGYARV